MVNLGLSFHVNLLSVIATTYILTWYILTPSPNQCQMTFMMEPPKFLPIPIEEDTNQDLPLRYASIKTNTRDQTTKSNYKLYMYSEFGFPMASHIRRDLRDSMPVLFVPGNAGSYQQVRSLASTCIRRQLQSLDALKFIFYTIDFGGQLSGISGELIDRQTLFVQRSLRQIIKMHPSDNEGVILIGHSVGGFISKFLFTKPGFQPKTVPLMISLASPLTRPYLILDDKMGEIYRKTEHYWNKTKAEERHTIAISISGGGSDRLVPMHLSMDSTFDISLTTESMKDVFLSADHVCVTWCRELMHKLANLLSALMDKKSTRLIPDKSIKLSIIQNELLLSRQSNTGTIISRGDWSTNRSNLIIKLDGVHHIHRDQLKDSIFIFEIVSNNNLLIVIDHIHQLKTSTIFGCNSISTDGQKNQVTCHGRSDLIPMASSIPINRQEPRRTVIKIPRDTIHSSTKFIGVDYTSHAQNMGPPEMIVIQRMSNQATSKLYIPSLLESLIRKILFSPIKLQITPRLNSTIELHEIELIEQQSDEFMLSVTLITSKCRNKGKPSSATMLYYREGFMSASAHLSADVIDQQATRTTMKLQHSNLWQDTVMREEMSLLEIYLDGTCVNQLELDLDLLNLAANMFQRHLGTILSCITFLVMGSIVILATKLTDMSKSTGSDLINFMTLFIGAASIITVSKFVRAESTQMAPRMSWIDNHTLIMVILVSSYGLLTFLNYFVRRLIDLAIIINNTQMILKRKVTSSTGDEQPNSTIDAGIVKNGNGCVKKEHVDAQARTDFDWPMIGIAIASGVYLTSAPVSALAIFLLIKISLCMNLESHANEESNKHCCGRNYVDQPTKLRDTKNDLIVCLIILNSLVFIVNLPDSLIKFTGEYDMLSLSGTTTTGSPMLNADYAALSLVLILVKLICDRLDRGVSETKSRWMRQRYLVHMLFRLTTSKLASVLAFVPIILIESNIRLLTSVALLLSMWLLNFFNFRLINPISE